MWKKFNNNPAGRNVGDCAVRAISVALSGAVLRKHGFIRESLPDSCPDCYSAEDFCMEHPNGIYVLGFGGHVATVVDGCIYDSWDSSHEIPQFVWRRRQMAFGYQAYPQYYPTQPQQMMPITMRTRARRLWAAP